MEMEEKIEKFIEREIANDNSKVGGEDDETSND